METGRRVPLDDVVLAILKPLALKYPEGPLLRNTRGRPWTKDAVNCRFTLRKSCLIEQRLTRCGTLSSTRPNGASETALAEVCGHEDKTMILKVYGHANLHNDLLKETVKKANRRAAHR